MGKKYETPSMEFLKKISDDRNANSPVLNIEFSGNGEYLAISYDNAKFNK